MKPATLNLIIYQGSTFDKPLQWSTGTPATPVNLTGYKCRMHIREKINSATKIIELTTENGRIIITDPLQGKFKLLISSDDTTGLSFKTAVYDLEMVDESTTPPTVKRLLAGTVTLSLEVTRNG